MAGVQQQAIGFNSLSAFNYAQRHLKAHFYSELWKGGERNVQRREACELSTELFHPLNENKVKTREVDYSQMPSEAIAQQLTDYQNELNSIEARKEWLSNEIEELQAILDERASDEPTDEDE